MSSERRIYTSGRRVHVPRRSAFVHAFSKRGFPADGLAFVDAVTNESITREQLERDALALAWALRNLSKLDSGSFSLDEGEGHTDLKPGGDDIVLLFSPNHVGYVTVELGAMAAGIPIALSGHSQTAKELAHQISLTAAKFFFVHPSLLDVFEDAMSALSVPEERYRRRVALMPVSSGSLVSGRSGRRFASIEKLLDHGNTFAPVPFDGEDASKTAVIFFSSGTTSLPKAVEISHLNLNSTAELYRDYEVARPGEVALTPLPYYHIAANILGGTASVCLGYTTVLFSSFTMESFLAGITKYKPQTLLLVPPLMAALGVHPLVDTTEFSGLHTITVGAAPIGEPLIERTYRRIKAKARPEFSIVQSWGMTESTSSATFTPRGRADNFASVGTLLANVEARFVDDEGRDVKRGEPGEIWLRGQGTMRGYLNNAKATEDTLTSDGWLRTGDIGLIDEEGFIFIVDRMKELIKYNAFQVPPAELEAVLGGHPDVSDVGVVGVPSPDGTTELPRAYISVRDPKFREDSSFCASVAKWFKARVADHKTLRGGVVLVDNVPRSPSGKILRRQLRLLLKDHPVVYDRTSARM